MKKEVVFSKPVLQCFHFISCVLYTHSLLYDLFTTGLFHVVQLPRLNSLVCHVPDSFDLAFKLRRKKMTIEVRIFSCSRVVVLFNPHSFHLSLLTVRGKWSCTDSIVGSALFCSVAKAFCYSGISI